MAVLVCRSLAWAGSLEKTLYSFAGGTDGLSPTGTLIFDKAGNLYGVTGGGGANNVGTIFKLTPSGIGSWTESVIYSFSGSEQGSLSIVLDTVGNLYGTTFTGGSDGCGTVYQLVQGSDGSWTYNTIYSFTCGTDGYAPIDVVFDAATGNLYGLATGGGANNSVFQLRPVVGGGWNFNLIHSFISPYDGSFPEGPLTLDSSGNVYGTTVSGGSYGNGIVFKLTSGTDGWVENILYNFPGGDNGAFPFAGVILDRRGNLYGATNEGGDDDVGIVYKLTPTKGQWGIHVIHSFTGGPEGGSPTTFNLLIDGAGNLYWNDGFWWSLRLWHYI